MGQIFRSMFLISVIGAILSILLLAVKPVTKRVFGSRWQYYIWVSVLIVMILPIKFSVPMKVDKAPLPQLNTNQNTEQNINITEMPEENINNEMGTNQNIAQYEENKSKISLVSRIKVSFLDILVYVWLLGAIIFFLCGLISYWRFLYAIGKNSVAVDCPELEILKTEKRIKRKIYVRVTDITNAPLMVGVFKATLLLPNSKISDKELHFILLHELTHLKRNDLLYKWFAMLVNSIHWFNPFIYFVCKQINEECEISCDLSVTKDLSEEAKKEYMGTIISLASKGKTNKILSNNN